MTHDTSRIKTIAMPGFYTATTAAIPAAEHPCKDLPIISKAPPGSPPARVSPATGGHWPR